MDAGWLGRKSDKGYYEYEKGNGISGGDILTNTKEFDWIVKRIVSMLINEAADALYLKIASAKDLETAMTKGVNYPKGLLAWCNEWGAKTTLNILENLQNHYGDDRYRPSPKLRDLVAQRSEFII